jgi:hypothetical protein
MILYDSVLILIVAALFYFSRKSLKCVQKAVEHLTTAEGAA